MSPLKTPRKRRKEARPSEIVEAGFAEFAEKGFHGTRLEDIAARAGVAKGTIYLYFDSKEALFEAAVRSRILPLLDKVNRLLDYYPGSSTFLLRQLIKTMHRNLTRREDLRTIIRIMIAEGERFPALTEFYYREFVSKMEAVMNKVIQRGIQRGEFRDGAIAELPIIVGAPGIMAAVWMMTFNQHHPIEPEKFLNAHLELVLTALKKEPGSS